MLNILKKDCPSYADQISADIVDSDENEDQTPVAEPEGPNAEDDIEMQIEKQVRKCIKQQSK